MNTTATARIRARFDDELHAALSGLRPGTALSVARYLLGTLDGVNHALVQQYADELDAACSATAQAVAELMRTEPHREAAATVTRWTHEVAAELEVAQASGQPDWPQEI